MLEWSNSHQRDNHRIHIVHGNVILQTWNCQLLPNRGEIEKEGGSLRMFKRSEFQATALGLCLINNCCSSSLSISV